MPKVQLLPHPDKSHDAPHLSKFGYATSKKASARHESLKRSSKKYGTLPVLKRLNLIRNITAPEQKSHKVMSQDVEYMKKLYKNEKISRPKVFSKKTKKTKKTKKPKPSRK